MPQITTVSQALDAEHGTALPAFKGHIKVIFPRKTGSNDHGEYSFENFIVTEGQNEIKVTLKNLPKLTIPKGKELIIIAEKGAKGWRGIKRLDTEYNGKEQKTIEVSAGATIENYSDYRAGGGSVAPARTSGTASAPAAIATLEKPTVYIFKSALLMRECLKAAQWVINNLPDDFDGREELEVQSLATTLFIGCDKLGLCHHMTIPKAQPAPAPAPAPEPEPEPEPEPVADPAPPPMPEEGGDPAMDTEIPF